MEIENTKTKNKPQANTTTLHSTKSQPILAGDEDDGTDERPKTTKKKESERGITNRRVSFASSSQYLEPINPFESFGK
jgi:hypothetical protein